MLTQEELAQAKRQLADMMKAGQAAHLSPDDVALLKKYPKHTLAEARKIDEATFPRQPLPEHVIHDAGEDFQYIQWQESGQPYSRQ